MNLLENILIVAGISLDIFAAMEIEGAMLAVVKRKTLIIACALVALLQMIFYFAGYFVCYHLVKSGILERAQEWGYIISIIVFYGYRHQTAGQGAQKGADPRAETRMI